MSSFACSKNCESELTAGHQQLETGNWQLLSLPHYLHNHSLVALTIEFGIEDSLPCPQIKFAGGDGHDHLMMNQQRLQM